ncbi:MAG: hypothetical protein WBE34_17510 [Candidatus Nitrosopolaris sp.]
MNLSPLFKWLYYLDIEPNKRQKPPVIESLSKRNGEGLNSSQTLQAEWTKSNKRS